jgi:hypothetical protein
MTRLTPSNGRAEDKDKRVLSLRWHIDFARTYATEAVRLQSRPVACLQTGKKRQSSALTRQDLLAGSPWFDFHGSLAAPKLEKEVNNERQKNYQKLCAPIEPALLRRAVF